jgi:hypothetical protein
MTEPRAGIPLAEGISCTLDSTKEHPERFLTILGGEKPLPLSKVQALALFKLMLGSLGQIVGEEVFNDPLLSQVNLVQAFHDSIEWLEGQDQTRLADNLELLKEAYEQYQFARDLQEEMMEAVQGWETLLDHQDNKLEEAAEELGITLDELDEEEEYELDDERDEHPDAT